MDQELKGLHEQLLKTKKDIPALLTLCEAYMKRGDYWHASFIAQKALDEKKDEDSLAHGQVQYLPWGIAALPE